MIDTNDIENGQVFQPFADKANELIRYQSGRWEHSVDGGKNYTYTPAVQEQNKANALAPGSIRVIEKVYDKITHRFDKEKWDAQTHAFQEDAKNPLTQRKFLPANLGVADSFTNHFEEEIEEALINADATSFLTLLELSCQGMVKSAPNFDPVFYLQDIARRVDQNINQKLVGYSLETILYQQTGKAIKDKIAVLIDHYQPLRTTVPQPKDDLVSGFKSYLKEGYREKLIPYLVKYYSGKMPKDIVPMLYALEELECLSNDLDQCDQTNLHTALTNTLGSIGGYNAFNDALPKYDPEQAHPTKKQKIENVKLLLKEVLGA